MRKNQGYALIMVLVFMQIMSAFGLAAMLASRQYLRQAYRQIQAENEENNPFSMSEVVSELT